MGQLCCRREPELQGRDKKQEKEEIKKAINGVSYTLKSDGQAAGASEEHKEEVSTQATGRSEAEDFRLDWEEDKVIEELEKYRNDYDEGVTFTPRGIAEYIESMFERETSDAESKKWVEKLKESDLRVCLKSGGTRFNESQPFIRAEMTFEEGFTLYQVAKVALFPGHRPQFDAQCKVMEMIETGVRCINLTYVKQKLPLRFGEKDAVSKRAFYERNGAIYAYLSSLSDPEPSQSVRTMESGVDRGVNYIGVHKFWRDPETNCVKYTFYVQSDFKIKITPALTNMFVAGGIRTWLQGFKKYLMNNLDKI